MLRAGHIELHTVKLDQARHPAPRALQFRPSQIARHHRVAGTAVVSMDHPAQTVALRDPRVASTRIPRVAAAQWRGRCGRTVPVDAPFTVNMVIAGEPSSTG